VAESINRFCASCGEVLRGDAKFCVNCGAPRPTAPVREPSPELAGEEPTKDADVVPEEPAFAPAIMPAAVTPAPATAAVAAPPAIVDPAAASAPKPSSTALLDRRQRWVLALGLIVIVVVSAVIIVVDKRDGNTSSASAAPVATTVATPAPSTTAVPATEPAPTVAPIAKLGGLDASAIVRRLDAELTNSASQVAALKNVIHAFDPQDSGPCRTSAADAAAQTGTIIKQRQAMVGRLTGLMTTSDATGRRLVTELRTAIGLSLQSDFDYQRWIAANGSTDATTPCARIRDRNADWQSAQSIAPRAGDAKKAFVADYDPIAAKAGVQSTWTYQDF
jgi:hypothetical protein